MPKIVGNITGKGSTAPLVYNVRNYGAVGDGTTNDFTAITAAITAASAAGGGTVFFPSGTYATATRIALKDKVSIQGAGRMVTTVKPIAGLVTSVFIGTSGDTVSDLTISDIGIDGNYSTMTVHGIQVTSGTRVTVRNCYIRNVGQSGLTFSTSTDCQVLDCLIETTGQEDATTGHGVIFNNGTRGIVARNQVLDIKGGMGIAGGATGTGNPGMLITGNLIRMAVSTTTFEAIGLTTVCDDCVISNNIIINSQDNGISSSGKRCTIIGNSIDEAYNHGIHCGGDTAVIGNVIRNVGQGGANHAFIDLTSSGCTVIGNRGFDSQGSPTTYHAVKWQSEATAETIVIGNHFTGYTSTKYKRLFDDSSIVPADSFVLDYGSQQEVTGSRGGNAALASLLTALANTGIIKNSTT